MELDEDQMRARGDAVIYTSNQEPPSVLLPTGPMFGDSYTKLGRKCERHIFQSMTMVGGRKYGGFIVDGIKNNEISKRLALSLGTAISHRSTGGNFLTNDWQNGIYLFEQRVNNFENLSSIYQPMSSSDDVRIHGNIPYILKKKDTISDEHFDKERAVMIQTYQNLNDQQIKLLGMSFLDASADDFDQKCDELEDVNTDIANEIAVKTAIEKVGKLMDKPFICTSCMQGITTKDNVLKHNKSAHGSQNVDLPEQERRQNFLVTRAIERNQEMNDRRHLQSEELIESLRRDLQLAQAAIVAHHGGRAVNPNINILP